jgi:UDPglucose 6-dehydrogenase
MGSSDMRVTVVGAGYVGLVTAVCLARQGNSVTCVDVSAERIAALESGVVPFYEPGLDMLLHEIIAAGRMRFSTRLADVLPETDIAMIAVGTPPRAQDGMADLRYVMRAAEDIARRAPRSLVMVTKSTVPVGTGDQIVRLVHAIRGKAAHDVVSNPEFLREGSAISDFNEPDRIVVGTETNQALASMRKLYAPFIERGVPFVATGRRTAELIKYASNAFLAMKVTFINEMADVCEAVDADVSEIALGMGLDKRIGASFLQAGPGFGGSCFPKDILALIKSANDCGTSMRLVESTIGVNETRKRLMARKIETALGGDVYGKVIAFLGLAFKPGTDDMRDSPAIAIANALRDRGAQIRGFDPKAGKGALEILPDIELCSGPFEAATGAHAVVLMTHWPELVALDPGKLANVMAERIAIDLRNAWDRVAYERCGFSYWGIGRPAAYPPTEISMGGKPTSESKAAELISDRR